MELKELVENIKDIKQKREELETAMEEKRQEEKELKAKADGKEDKTSGFYQDAERARQEKHKEWTEAFNKRQKYINDSDQKIESMKSELIQELEEKAKAVDENRNITKQERQDKVSDKYKEVQSLNSRLYSKKQELKYFELTLSNENKDKNEILRMKQEEIDSIDKQIKNDVGLIKAIENENPEKIYNDIKNEIAYVKQLTVANVDKEQKVEPTPTTPEPTPTTPEPTPTTPEPTPTTPEPTPTTPESTPTTPEPTPTTPEPTPTTPTSTPTTGPNNIYSNSFIHINASTGKAEVYLSDVEGKQEIDNIGDIIKNKKEQFKRLNINKMLEDFGVESKIEQFMIRRKINPIILEAIQKDEELTDKYIEAVVNNGKFPFEYKLNLENSSLSNKETNFMNRLALKERKIEGNEITGAEKLHVIKNAFRKIKNKAQKRFEKKEEPKQLGEGSEKTNPGEKFRKENFVDIEKLEKSELENQEKAMNKYKELSDEQKKILSEKTPSEIQRSIMGIDYAMATRLKEIEENSQGQDNSKTKGQTSATQPSKDNENTNQDQEVEI